MGTHPIFESDFDCLTDGNREMKVLAILSIVTVCSALTGSKRKAKLDELTEGGSKAADITATQFQQLVQGSINERVDYSIVIEYTALPERFGCKVCADFHADFGYTAKASKGRKTYFLSVDFGGIQMQGPFQYMGVNNVPALVVVTGKGGPTSDAEKLLTGSVKKEHPFPPQITKFVESAAKGVTFGPVVKPINFTPLIVGGFFLVTIGTLLWVLRKVIFNRIPAAMIIIGFCVITTSGYTFCQIRGAPVKGRDGSLFASGGRQMYLSEAYILMMSELACASGLVIMNGKGAVRSTVGLAIGFVAYTILLAAFHVKTPRYPYYIAQLF